MEDALKDTRYYPDRAMKAARKGLAEWLGVSENRVLPTAGGAAAIDLILSRRTGTVHVYPVTFGEYAERAVALGLFPQDTDWNAPMTKLESAALAVALLEKGAKGVKG